MTTAVFSSTKGVEIRLHPVRLTTEHVAAFYDGYALFNDRGDFRLDPTDTALHMIDIDSRGGLRLDGVDWPKDHPEQLCSVLDSSNKSTRVFLGIHAQQLSSYQHFVTALDQIAVARSSYCQDRRRLEAILVSDEEE